MEFDISKLSKEDKDKVIKELIFLEDHIGCDFNDVLLYDEITLVDSDVQIIGKNNNVLKIEKNGITYIKFNEKKFPVLDSPINLRIVGKANINDWQGTKTSQIIIEEYEIVEYSL